MDMAFWFNELGCQKEEKKRKSNLHLNKMDMAYLRVGTQLTIYDDEYNSTLKMLYDIGKKLLASLQQCDCDFIGWRSFVFTSEKQCFETRTGPYGPTRKTSDHSFLRFF